MSKSRPSKRPRPDDGGAFHDTIPFLDDIHVVHAREGRLRRVARETVWTASTERSSHHASDPTWTTATSWEPLDDPELALDPDGQWYDEAVFGDVMQPNEDMPRVALPKKQKKSKVARRPHVVWKEIHRQSYLEEIIRVAGRGDFQGAKECPDCLVRNAKPGVPEYRCLECFVPDLVCLSCCVKRHRCHAFHRISRWRDSKFEEVTLRAMGLVVQLNHSGSYCENPIACHSAMLVMHTNGIHQVTIRYCGCSKAIPQHLQLLRRGLYPASQLSVKTCASFQLLDLLHKLALTTKSSTYDFYRALEKLTNNTGIDVPKLRYRALFRMSIQWRHLKLLKWAGRGHDPSGVVGTKSGELAVVCPSCPHPGINLPEGWEDAPIAMRFLYMMFVAIDANFRLKNQLVSNYSQDPGLGIGWGYMLPREEYESYVLSRAKDEDISTCVGLQALAQANTKFSRGLRYTGVGGTFCGRSEMILRVGNLQKGERYPNMDFIIGSTVHAIALLLILLSYDIACQWFVNVFKRMNEHWPDSIKISPTTKLIPAIPKLHEPMHAQANHEVFSLNFTPGVGKSDLETPERVWSAHNALGNSTKTQGPGGRHDVLDDHFGFWNWSKYVGLGKTLMSKYKAAIAERNVQVEGHRGLTESLDPLLVAKWEQLCVEWEGDGFPKTKPNPYHTEGSYMTEAQERKELAKEDEVRIARGDVTLHATSPSAFVFLAMELEDCQRRIRRQARDTSSSTTIRKEGNLTEQRNILRTRLRGWEQLLSIYMPGLLQYKEDLASGTITAPYTPQHSNNPEDADIWLPSRIANAHRSRVCREGLAEIEERIRTAQCYDALDVIRQTLKIKSRMVMFKNKNVRGQREGLRSRAVIDRVHERARVHAAKYRAARDAKYALSGGGAWEEVLRVLMDADVRGYQDKNRLRVRTGRLGTLDDEQVEAAERRGDPSSAGTVEDIDMEDDAGIFLWDEERTRRDGTGETRRTLSWIWTTKSRTPNDDDETDDILRSEWAKSRARANRCKEEVLLLREEMRRVLVFLEWKSEWWVERQELREGLLRDLDEGLRAFAMGQADLQRRLAVRFREIWKGSLQDEATDNCTSSNNDADDPEDDGEEDDDDEESDIDDNLGDGEDDENGD